MIGKLDRRVAIQERSVTEDSFGGGVEGWATVRTESASYNPGNGGERRISAREHASHPATFEFHSSTLTKGIRPNTHRLVFDGDNWDIVSAVEIGRGRYISVAAARRLEG